MHPVAAPALAVSVAWPLALPLQLTEILASPPEKLKPPLAPATPAPATSGATTQNHAAAILHPVRILMTPHHEPIGVGVAVRISDRADAVRLSL